MLKRLLVLAAALAIAAAVALPAFAQPEITSAPFDPYEEETLADGAQPDPAAPEDGETMAIFFTQPPAETTFATPVLYGAQETIEATQPAAAPEAGPLARLSANHVAYAALALSLFAAVLACAALAKSGGKKAANATGNYKNFF